MDNSKKVVASWSGGIDSTAVILNLLRRGYNVTAVSLIFGDETFISRESKARNNLIFDLKIVANSSGGKIHNVEHNARWLWEFSPDGIEIPRRNKHIMDWLIMNCMVKQGITNLAMGEYTGADTWVVRDHVSQADCDHRALSAYLYLEYGLEYRLISLQDFGESRYKADRLQLGIQASTVEVMTKTTNCLANVPKHCGTCYKCQERHAAFVTLGVEDKTEYSSPPEEGDRYSLYLQQMSNRVTYDNHRNS